MKLTLKYPLKLHYYNQRFGEKSPMYTNMGMLGHNGIDFTAVHGIPVYAAHEGICYPEIDGSGGNGVVIRTLNDYEYEGKQVRFKTIYWHLMQSDAVVKTGQKVLAGELIGYADNTGMSTGDHLHFGLKPQMWNENDWTWYNPDQNNGYLGAIDPAPFFEDYTPPTDPVPPALIFFNKNLYFPMTDSDVKLLQQVLNRDPDTRVAMTGPGSPGQETNVFGPLTLSAVAKYQRKYNISPAVGYCGPITRAKLNQTSN